MSLRIPAITNILPFPPFPPICWALQPIEHGFAWLSLIRMLVTPLGNLSRLILKPVSLTLSLLLDDEPLVDPEDDVVDEADDDFRNSSLKKRQTSIHISCSWDLIFIMKEKSDIVLIKIAPFQCWVLFFQWIHYY